MQDFTSDAFKLTSKAGTDPINPYSRVLLKKGKRCKGPRLLFGYPGGDSIVPKIILKIFPKIFPRVRTSRHTFSTARSLLIQ